MAGGKWMQQRGRMPTVGGGAAHTASVSAAGLDEPERRWPTRSAAILLNCYGSARRDFPSRNSDHPIVTLSINPPCKTPPACTEFRAFQRRGRLSTIQLILGRKKRKLPHQLEDGMSKRVALYVRVSTDGQTTANQTHELAAWAARCSYTVVKIYKDEGISGAKGRDKRPGLDAMLKDANRRPFDQVAVWAVDRLGRSMSDLVRTLDDLKAAGIDLYLHGQGWTRRRPRARRCSACWVSSPSSSGP